MSTILSTLASDTPSLPPAPLPPGDHTLIFYEDDSALLDGLSHSICSAICSGNSAIIVATAAHHDGLVTYLRNRCPDAHTAIIEGRLFLLDAEEMLSKITVGGQLDPDRAITVLGSYIAILTAAAHGKNPYVFAFGELVALLWERGNQTAALHLELLCRQIVQHLPLQLCCGYPMRLFPTDTGPTPIVEFSSRRTRLLHSKDLSVTPV
jgi:hypothetical protein